MVELGFRIGIVGAMTIATLAMIVVARCLLVFLLLLHMSEAVLALVVVLFR